MKIIRQHGQDFSDGLHPRAHHLILQFRGDDVEALGQVEKKVGVRSFDVKLLNLIADQYELSDLVHQIVQKVEVDPYGFGFCFCGFIFFVFHIASPCEGGLKGSASGLIGKRFGNLRIIRRGAGPILQQFLNG